MTCEELRTHLGAYVDGELDVAEALAVETHVGQCRRCRGLADAERQFRQLLRRQPRESAPPEFRARILARCRREARRAALRPWLAALPAAAAAAVVVAVLAPRSGQPSPFLQEVVVKHATFAQVERPAEFASGDRQAVETWLRAQAGLRAVVPDYSPAGIRLMGARIADLQERRAAYLLYEKGHTLLSVFMLPQAGRPVALGGRRLTYRGQTYFADARQGYRTVSWAEGDAVFGLVSTLDVEALLECADRLRQDYESQRRL